MPVVSPQPPLGKRALALAVGQLGVKEIPGPKHHPKVLEYLSGCMRDGVAIGKWLQTDETPWCAAFACWCAHHSLAPGEGGIPHGYRAAVRELCDVAFAAVGLPLTWYLASPIWVRTSLVEPAPTVAPPAPSPSVAVAVTPRPTLEPTSTFTPACSA